MALNENSGRDTLEIKHGISEARSYECVLHSMLTLAIAFCAGVDGGGEAGDVSRVQRHEKYAERPDPCKPRHRDTHKRLVSSILLSSTPD